VFIWDCRGTEKETIEGLSLDCPVHYVWATDTRGVAVDPITEVTEVTDAIEACHFAHDIIESKDLFEDWAAGARSILAEVVVGFQKMASRGRRQFIDLMEACKNEQNLRAALKSSRRGRDLIEDVLCEAKQTKAIMMTLHASLDRLWPLASAMVPDLTISLTDWVSGTEAVLFLLHDDFGDGFERWAFGRLMRLVISRPEPSDSERFTFFIKEVTRVPFGEYLSWLADFGREKGCEVVVG
jgi:hypothetical protein